jgi:hypothetical protein
MVVIWLHCQPLQSRTSWSWQTRTAGQTLTLSTRMQVWPKTEGKVIDFMHSVHIPPLHMCPRCQQPGMESVMGWTNSGQR